MPCFFCSVNGKPFRRRDLLGIRDLNCRGDPGILDTAENFREINSREIKKVPTLRGKTVINLFFENSTRTRTSFELAPNDFRPTRSISAYRRRA